MYKIYKRKVPEHHKCYWIIEDTVKEMRSFVFHMEGRLKWNHYTDCRYDPNNYESYTEASTEEELLPAMKMIAMMEGKVGEYV